MEAIIEQLRKELKERFSEYTVDSFIGFLRSNKNLQIALTVDFANGKILCVNIIERSKGKNER